MQGMILLCAILSFAVLACCPVAVAYIKIDYPISRMYDQAGFVVVGTVVRVNPDNRVLEVKVEETPKGKSIAGHDEQKAKGESIGHQFRVQIVNPSELINRVAADQPLVIFGGGAGDGGLVALHMADTWLLAERIPNVSPPAWRVTGHMEKRRAFPGRTAALVRLVADLKAGKSTLLDETEKKVSKGGKSTLLDETENRVFKPEIRELARLNVTKPAWISAEEVNGDKKPDLLIGTAEGVRLFLATVAGFEDATGKCGLAGAKGAACAWGDVNGDGKLDLLLDATLWINDGRKFIPAKPHVNLPDKVPPLAVALMEVTGDDKPDALLLLANGQLRVFANPGEPTRSWTAQPVRQLWKDETPALATVFGDWGDNGRPHVMVVRHNSMTRYALDADGGPPADFARLTAAGWPALKRLDAPIQGAIATAIYANADRRPDFLVAAGQACFLLVNRGFGCYLVNSDPASTLIAADQHAVPFKLGSATPITSADLHGRGLQDLLVLTEDGRLYAVNNAASNQAGSKPGPGS